ncbi:response regulator transcription factor [Thalassotalea aquiviva]|uniref:response regulator transcription factor n=1 Tax=Thalassotalea aquiviva TaxID=3242415 RepID=UPI00352A0337
MQEQVEKSILIVEDNKIISLALKKKFESKGYIVHQAFRGDVVERLVIRHSPSCVLLDIGLPHVSGFDVCEELKTHYDGPVIFLTADETSGSELKGIKLGADDFIVKTRPFEVIHARVERLLGFEKDHKDNQPSEIVLGKFLFNKRHHYCKYDDQLIEFSNHEFELLYFLLIHKDALLSRDHIYLSLKGINYDGISRGIDISISRIKKKLVNAGLNKEVIITIRSKGYKLQSQKFIDNEVICAS